MGTVRLASWLRTVRSLQAAGKALPWQPLVLDQCIQILEDHGEVETPLSTTTTLISPVENVPEPPPAPKVTKTKR